jgi:hypothetical protein
MHVSAGALALEISTESPALVVTFALEDFGLSELDDTSVFSSLELIWETSSAAVEVESSPQPIDMNAGMKAKARFKTILDGILVRLLIIFYPPA